MEKLLIEDTFAQIRMIYYIRSGPNSCRSSKEIEKATGLSSYKVEKFAVRLTDKIAVLAGKKLPCKVEKSEEGYVITGEIEDMIERLIWSYCKQSDRFKLLDMIVRENEISINKFIEETFMCNSNGYNIKDELIDFLKDYEVTLDSNFKLKGDEYTIRQLLFSIYFTIFKNIESPYYGYVDAEAEELLEQLREKGMVRKELSSGDRNKIFLFLGMTALRINGKNYLEIENHYFLAEKANHPFAKFLKKRFSLSEEIASMEYQNIQSFLEVEELSTVKEIILRKEMDQKILASANDFLRTLDGYHASFQNIRLAEVMTSGIHGVFRKMWLIAGKRVDSLFYLKKDEVSQHYPVQFILCRTFLESFLLKEEDFGIEVLTNHSLMLNLVSSLVNIMEFGHMEYRVSIRLDFSLGTSYQNDIYNLIIHKLNLPLTIVSSTTETADILLTDCPTTDHKEKHVTVWSYPATPEDWSNLTKQIAECLIEE